MLSNKKTVSTAPPPSVSPAPAQEFPPLHHLLAKLRTLISSAATTTRHLPPPDRAQPTMPPVPLVPHLQNKPLRLNFSADSTFSALQKDPPAPHPRSRLVALAPCPAALHALISSNPFSPFTPPSPLHPRSNHHPTTARRPLAACKVPIQHPPRSRPTRLADSMTPLRLSTSPALPPLPRQDLKRSPNLPPFPNLASPPPSALLPPHRSSSQRQSAAPLPAAISSSRAPNPHLNRLPRPRRLR